MIDEKATQALNRPIRVIMFGSGPNLTHDARLFLCEIEAHPEIELLAAFCQAESQGFAAVARDLWRRRGLLAVPLLFVWAMDGISRWLLNPRAEMKMKSSLAQISKRIFYVPDIHSQQIRDKISALAPDLGLVYGSPILKPCLFNLPTFGTLGIHHGKVPKYRGNKTTFWAMYEGEKTAGVTIQKINAGLDTGSIVKEGEVIIGQRSRRAVWHELENLGLSLYIQAILEVKNGTAICRPQEGPKGKLYKNPTLRDLLIFWGRQFKRHFIVIARGRQWVKDLVLFVKAGNTDSADHA